MTKTVSLVEVGLRDGLQNEKSIISNEVRIELAKRIAESGVQRIEVAAFVRADKIPQMAGSKEISQAVLAMQKSKSISNKVQFSALVPNEKGMQDAIEAGIKEIAIFASATEAFSQANINCTIEESFKRFVPVLVLAKKHKIKVRGYLSVCFGCPYEGKVSEAQVMRLAKKLHQLGCYEISIGDTIGVADPLYVQSLFKKLKKVVPVKKLAGHFHDTRGTAVANVLAAYQVGVRVFDASIGGLGGCPYAPGSAGNVAMEDVIYMFQKMKIKTAPKQFTNSDIDLGKYIEASRWMSTQMNREMSSKLAKAGLPKN